MAIYAPGNGGELKIFTHFAGEEIEILNNYIYSAPGTKNMIINFEESSNCALNTIDGTHVTNYMNVSCNKYADCVSSNITCPILTDAHCNIDCTNKCQNVTVTAKEGTHDVSWLCNDNDKDSCDGAILYCTR
eukprot:325729_1